MTTSILPFSRSSGGTSHGQSPRPRRGTSACDFRCVECSGELTWHQPDPDDPNRLLGTCPACGAWHVLDLLHPKRVVFALIPRAWQVDRAAVGQSNAADEPSPSEV